MFRIKKYQDVYNRDTIRLPPMRRTGEFKLVVRNPQLEIVQETPWFPNLLTDTGDANLARTGTPWCQYCHVGSGNATPLVSDTALQIWRAQTASQLSSIYTPGVAPNYQFAQTKGWRFNAGSLNSTIKEVGLSYATTNNAMCVRSLVIPTVTVAIDQYLDIYYKLTVYPYISDVVDTTTIEGATYNYTMRYSKAGDLYPETLVRWANDPSTVPHGAYGGNIGTITGAPSTFDNGANGGWVYSLSEGLYGAGYQNSQLFWNLQNANDYGTNGIRSILWVHNLNQLLGKGGYQVQFNRVSDNKGILKTSTKVLYFDFTFTWA